MSGGGGFFRTVKTPLATALLLNTTINTVFILTVLRVAANNVVNSEINQIYSTLSSFLSQLDHYEEAEILTCTCIGLSQTTSVNHSVLSWNHSDLTR